MRKRTVGGGIILLAGAILARESLGWVVEKVLDALSAGIAGKWTWATFPWANALGAILMLIGAWLLLRDRALRNQGTGTAALYDRMNLLYHRLETCVRGNLKDVYPDIIGELAAVFMSMEKLKIPTPVLDGNDTPKLYRTGAGYVGAMMPMIRDGHTVEARQHARDVIKGLGVEEAPMPRPVRPSLRLPWR